MSLDPLSKHIFLFPFRWDVKKGDIFESAGISMEDYEQELKSLGWKDEKYYDNDIDHLDYNEFQYFYPFVRDALYDFNTKNENIIRHLEYPTNLETDTYTITFIENKHPKSITLKVKFLLINLYTTGIGIISYHLWNDSYSDFKDILAINDFGRRIYPPYCGENFNLDYVRSTTIAQSIRLQIGLSVYEEDFLDFLDLDNRNSVLRNEEQKLPEFIIDLLLPKQNKEVTIQPVLDDRMFVICWFKGNDRISAEFSKEDKNYKEEFCYGYSNSDNWYKYIFIDVKEPSVHNITLRYDQLNNSTYARYADYKYNGESAPTLYGISRFSLVSYSANSYLIGTHTTTIYYKMIELCLMQRASIIHFSSIVSQITNSFNQKEDFDKEDIKKRIDKLYRDYIRFINKFYIREITHQEQGIEMYDMMIKSMNINTQIKGLDDEIAELHQYSNNIEQQKQTEQSNNLSLLAYIFLPASLVFGILGANIYGKDALLISSRPDWNALGWIAIGCAFSLYFGLQQRHKIKKLLWK